MTNSPRSFREELISKEPVNSGIEQQYRKELEEMINQEITGVRRMGWWARDIFLLLFGAALIGSAIFNLPVSLPFFGRLLWILSGAFTIVIALMGMRVALKKKTNLREDSKIFALVGSTGMIIVAFAVLSVAFLTRDLDTFVVLAPHALLILIIGILVSISDKVQQGELNTREKLLEIEHRLAALDERLGDSGNE